MNSESTRGDSKNCRLKNVKGFWRILRHPPLRQSVAGGRLNVKPPLRQLVAGGRIKINLGRPKAIHTQANTKRLIFHNQYPDPKPKT